MHTAYDKTIRILLPVVAGAGCMLTLLGVANAVSELGHATAHVGDIVSFTAIAAQPVGDDTRLIVTRLNQIGCVLDLRILRKSGGSLVVESQINEVPGNFRVHWAGQRTSADAGNCGDSADLVVEGRELDILARAAGGYGAGEKRFPGYSMVTDNNAAAYLSR